MQKKLNILRLKWSTLLAILFGLLSQFIFTLIGELKLSEILAISCLPFIKFAITNETINEFTKFVYAVLIILLGFILSSVVNDGEIILLIRASANLLLSIPIAIFLYYLFSKNENNIFWILFFLAISTLVANQENAFSFADFDHNSLKTYFSSLFIFVIVFFMYFFDRNYKKRYTIILLILTGFGLMFLNIRSLGLITLLSGLLLIYNKPKIRLSYLITSLFLFLFLYYLYIFLTLKYELSQSTLNAIISGDISLYNPLHLLEYGRKSTYISFLIALDNPIFGLGPWSAPTNEYLILMGDSHNNENHISVHSTIMMSWLWGGLLGLIGAILILSLIIKSLFDSNNFPEGYRIVNAFILIMSLWALFFSPHGHLRFSIPLAISYYLALKFKFTKLNQYNASQN